MDYVLHCEEHDRVDKLYLFYRDLAVAGVFVDVVHWGTEFHEMFDGFGAAGVWDLINQILGLHVNLTKTALLLRVRGPGANRALRQYVLRKDGKRHWQVDTEDGPALIPIERSVVYLGTHLELGDCSLANTRHRLKEAKGREAKMHRAVRSRRVFGLAHRLRIWRACAVSSATFGMAPLGIRYSAATLLRSWFYRQLRAVTNYPAHITHESNTALREKFGIVDPVDALHTAITNKLENLMIKTSDITNNPDNLAHWRQVLQECQEVTTQALPSQTIVPTEPTTDQAWPARNAGSTSHPQKPFGSIVLASTKLRSLWTNRKPNNIMPMHTALMACHNVDTAVR